MNKKVIIHNPESGTENHDETIRSRTDELGYTLEETSTAGEAIGLATEAAKRGNSRIVAAGGDGTVNEVVRGIAQADAFDSVELGILPLGTGNNFAEQIGVPDIETAFTVLESGDRRQIDIGYANDRLFMNSCVAGVTAESSGETSPEMKRKLGVLAYVLTTLRTLSDFESLRLEVEIGDSDQATTVWSGDALCVLVGNGRQYPTSGSSQANMEDGLLDVVVIEDISAMNLMSDTVVERLLGRDSASIERFTTPSVQLASADTESIGFSLDGEIIQERELSLSVQKQPLTVTVGPAYDPTPD